MLTNPVPKYHIAPHFSINPVEAGGVLELGSIITDIRHADELPLNKTCLVSIPSNELFCSHQQGFITTTSRMLNGEFGLWAKVLGMTGIGGELSGSRESGVEHIYTFRSIDTVYFSPSQSYLEESMNRKRVKNYVRGSGFDPVYMVTGLKTARGPSVKLSTNSNVALTAELGLQQPGGAPVELGPKFNHSRDVRKEMGFEDSTDFVIGIRVKKLVYKKHWLTRSPGELLHFEYNKGASMLDGEDVKRDDDEVVGLDDDSEAIVETERYEIDGEVFEMAWVLN